MSELQSLKEKVASLSQQSGNNAVTLLGICDRVASMVQGLQQLLEGSGDANYETAVQCLTQAIKSMKDAGVYLQEASNAGDEWAGSQKVLSKTR